MQTFPKTPKLNLMPLLNQDTTFTKEQMLNRINAWTLEPLTPKEIQFLHESISTHTGDYQYGQNDIDSLILELLDNIDN